MTVTRRACAFAFCAVLASAAPAAATVQVAFLEPESYSDAIGRDGTAADAALLEALARHLRQVGERVLAPGQALTIEVLDLDLAGRHEPRAAASLLPPRVLRDIAWPRARLRFALTQDGATLRDGEATLVDYDYLARRNAYAADDPLRYEKQMLADWLRREFGAPASGPSGAGGGAFAYGPSGGASAGGGGAPAGIVYGGGGGSGGSSGGALANLLSSLFPSGGAGAPACR